MSRTEPAARDLLRAFETRTLARDAWTHRAHLTVAYAYLEDHPPAAALIRMRAGIQAFNAAHGIESTRDSGYHETMTHVWMRLMHAAMRGEAGDGVDALLERHTYLLDTWLPLLFYSRERIMSDAARVRFVPPDVTALP